MLEDEEELEVETVVIEVELEDVELLEVEIVVAEVELEDVDSVVIEVVLEELDELEVETVVTEVEDDEDEDEDVETEVVVLNSPYPISQPQTVTEPPAPEVVSLSVLFGSLEILGMGNGITTVESAATMPL